MFAADNDAARDEALLVLRGHWRALVAPVLVLFAVAAVTGFLVAALSPGLPRDVVLGCALVVVLRWSAVPWLRWLTTVHTVTRGGMYVRTGTRHREGRTVPLARVADVTYTQDTLAQRLSGSGTLIVAWHPAVTGGEADGDEGPQAVAIPGIAQVARVQRRVLALAEQARTAPDGGPADRCDG